MGWFVRRLRSWLTRERIAELVRFNIVGLITFGTDTGGLVVLRSSTPMPLAVDVAAAYTIASLVNFVGSRQWVFEQAAKGAHPRVALARYAVVVVVGLLITTAAVPGLTTAGMDYRAAKILMSFATGTATYFLLSLWVFREPWRETDDPSVRLEPGEVELDRCG